MCDGQVRYEDLVADPAAVVALLRKQFNLAPEAAAAAAAAAAGGGGGFLNVEDSTKTASKDYEAYKEFYGKV